MKQSWFDHRTDVAEPRYKVSAWRHCPKTRAMWSVHDGLPRGDLPRLPRICGSELEARMLCAVLNDKWDNRWTVRLKRWLMKLVTRRHTNAENEDATHHSETIEATLRAAVVREGT